MGPYSDILSICSFHSQCDSKHRCYVWWSSYWRSVEIFSTYSYKRFAYRWFSVCFSGSLFCIMVLVHYGCTTFNGSILKDNLCESLYLQQISVFQWIFLFTLCCWSILDALHLTAPFSGIVWANLCTFKKSPCRYLQKTSIKSHLH